MPIRAPHGWPASSYTYVPIGVDHDLPDHDELAYGRLTELRDVAESPRSAPGGGHVVIDNRGLQDAQRKLARTIPAAHPPPGVIHVLPETRSPVGGRFGEPAPQSTAPAGPPSATLRAWQGWTAATTFSWSGSGRWARRPPAGRGLRVLG